MDRAAMTKRDVMEHMLLDESVEPTDLPLSLLEDITNSFSEDLEIGRGGFAVVYKGMLLNGIVAVKKMSHTHMHENKFHQEIECLMKLKHKNVVRFLGYCAHTQGRMESYKGKLVMADVQQRLLCFEYLPKGSLHDHITGASCELEWGQCYRIIKGICHGLHYLHKNRIVHLDLKPANILLDDNMVPKITDFGLSRCFDEMQSRAITSKLWGSLGYLAPEFFRGIITFKSDIYSLGVIIMDILRRQKLYPIPDDEDVLESLGNRLEKLEGDPQFEQFRVCIEIWKECTDFNPARRPDGWLIIDKLDKAEIVDSSIETGVSNLLIAEISHSREEGHEAPHVKSMPLYEQPGLGVTTSEVEQHGEVSNIIGAIGRELFLKCLLRLSRSDYGLVASLSRDLRSLVRSGEIYRLRREQGVAEHWVYFTCDGQEWHGYDPYRGRWMQLPSMPADECFMISDKESLAVGTELLVFGKAVMAHMVFRYSILTNSWTQVDPMNSPRYLFGSTSVGEKAYVAGGRDSLGQTLSSSEMYDSEAHTWTPLPSMHRARWMCSVVFMDEKLYVIGGVGNNDEALTCGEEYDFKGQSWREIENMYEHQPGATNPRPPTAVVNNELYVADFSTKDVRKYDKQNNRWITLGKWPQRSRLTRSLHFRACGDLLLLIGDTNRRTFNGCMVELNTWAPDEQPLVWNLIARWPGHGGFVYNAAVMSC